MRDLKTVIAFTIKDMVKRKSFIISTLIIVLIIIIGFNIPNIMDAWNSDSTGDGSIRLLVVDSTNLFEESLEKINSMDLGYEVKTTNEALTFEDIKEQIDNLEIDEAIIIEQNNDTYKLRYIVQDMTMMESIPEDLCQAG